MTLRIPAKVLLHVWSYDFYDMTLSTGKQRRHMINPAFTYPNVELQKPVWHFVNAMYMSGSKMKSSRKSARWWHCQHTYMHVSPGQYINVTQLTLIEPPRGKTNNVVSEHV